MIAIIAMWSLALGASLIFICQNEKMPQWGKILAIPILMSYNGERGKWKGMKWFFYLYYPAHLIVVGIIRIALHGNTRLVF